MNTKDTDKNNLKIICVLCVHPYKKFLCVISAPLFPWKLFLNQHAPPIFFFGGDIGSGARYGFSQSEDVFARATA